MHCAAFRVGQARGRVVTQTEKRRKGPKNLLFSAGTV